MHASTESVHAVRAAFENALASESCMHNAGLWRMYVLWCAQSCEYGKEVKEVLFRGMRACPWAKGLLMVAFDSLRGHMKWEELQDVYKVLGEKELRVHVDLDEQMEEIEEKRQRRLLE
jgi:hypothetical protein